MAYGTPPKNTHSLPPGRAPLGYATDLTGRSNPDVNSKGARNGAYEAASDPRNLRGELYRDEVAPSLPAHTLPTAKPHTETVGWLDGKFHEPTHPNMHRHDPGAPGTQRTEIAHGQAHSASGGQFGKQSRATQHGVPPKGTNAEPLGKLNRARER